MSANNTKNNNAPWIVGGIVGAIILYNVLTSDESGGISDTSDNTKPDKSNLTYLVGAYDIWADEIEAAIYGGYAIVSLWEDDTAIAFVLKQMETIDDVYQLIRAYGRRYVGVFISDGGNLPQAVTEYLDNDLKSEVNQDYQTKGIPFQW